jgi:hypothetical protein
MRTVLQDELSFQEGQGRTGELTGGPPALPVSSDAKRTEDDKIGNEDNSQTLNIYGVNRPVTRSIFPGNNTQIVALNKSRGVIRFRGRFIQRLVSGDVH